MAQVNTTDGVVEFHNVNAIKKKSVRGLLRKRAKKYESESDSDPSEVDSDNDAGAAMKRKQKAVRKTTMASAFKMIMSKKIESDDEAPSKGASAAT